MNVLRIGIEKLALENWYVSLVMIGRRMKT
jgi:hypothetical protein